MKKDRLYQLINTRILIKETFADRLKLILDLTPEEEEEYLNYISLIDTSSTKQLNRKRKTFALLFRNEEHPVKYNNTFIFNSPIFSSIFYQVSKTNIEKVDFLIQVLRLNLDLFKNNIFPQNISNEEILKKFCTVQYTNPNIPFLPYQQKEIKNIILPKYLLNQTIPTANHFKKIKI